MPRRNLHNKPFDEGTQDKLDLYREYLREWLPVFINGQYIEALQIFDFFAGPGVDMKGNPGSPIITCEELRKALSDGKKHTKICAYFNEYASDKFKDLSSCIEGQKNSLPQVEFTIMQNDFHHAFSQWKHLMNRKVANLLFLDQNGVQQITESIFRNMVRCPKTDFIFFISSAMVNRFKNQPEIRSCVPATDEDFSQMNGNNVHRILTNAYLRWIPEGLKYYLGSFSIKKGANVYGIVFGSGHPRGIDKFLRVIWKHGGDANFDIDKDGIDPAQPSLFPDLDKPKKISMFEEELEKELLGSRLKTNKDVYLFALQNGMLATHARNALKVLVKDKKLPDQSFHVSYGAWEKPKAEIIRHFKERIS